MLDLTIWIDHEVCTNRTPWIISSLRMLNMQEISNSSNIIILRWKSYSILMLCIISELLSLLLRSLPFSQFLSLFLLLLFGHINSNQDKINFTIQNIVFAFFIIIIITIIIIYDKCYITYSPLLLLRLLLYVPAVICLQDMLFQSLLIRYTNHANIFLYDIDCNIVLQFIYKSIYTQKVCIRSYCCSLSARLLGMRPVQMQISRIVEIAWNAVWLGLFEI